MLLEGLTDEQKAALAYEWERWYARPSQREPAAPWLYWLLLAGRGFGKTRIGAEWIRRKARVHGRLHLIAPTAADARDVMVNGESGIMAISPPWERPSYFPSRRQLVWPNGAQALLFSGEDPDSLRGPQCEALWADEIAAWQYPQETWDMALMGLRLGPSPQACVTTTPKPIRVIRDLVTDPDCAVTSGSTFENLENLGPSYKTIIGRYEGTRLGRQELYAELLEDEGLAYRFSELIHCVKAFAIPGEWERSEGMDFGSTAPTAWCVYATDYEGIYVCFDEFYEPGLPSETAPKILTLRGRGGRPQPWEGHDSEGWKLASNVVWGDPQSMANRPAIAGRFGARTSIGQEFADYGVPVTPANNDRSAGYIRISELLRRDPARRFPEWHHFGGTYGPDEAGAPRLFFFGDRCLNLVAQLKDAPIEEEGRPLAGEAVQGSWESSNGHAHAQLRYWALSRPGASTEPVVLPSDPRERVWVESMRRMSDPDLVDDDEDVFVRSI